MAQWSDPRVTGTQSSLAGVGSRAGDVAFDAGLRSHMLKVYNYMASGVLLTGIVAMLFAQTELAQNLMLNPSFELGYHSVTFGGCDGNELWTG
jgi:FtsH-binding integral membrane protein